MDSDATRSSAPASTADDAWEAALEGGTGLRSLTRWGVAALAVLHGAVHVLGGLSGVGIETATELRVGPVAAVLWFIAGALLIGAGTWLLVDRATWWRLGLVAVIVSQILIVTQWRDAWFGTIPDVLIGLAALHGRLAFGARSFRSRFRSGVAAAAAAAASRADAVAVRDRLVTEADVSRLPEPLATYLRRSGAVGRPAVSRIHATVRGRIRESPTGAWTTFVGEQTNTFGPSPTRYFFLDATRSQVPVEVLHVLVDGHASMEVALLSLVHVVDERGPEMDRGESVTLFNDMCLLAPSALVHAPVRWEPVDGRRVRGRFHHGDCTVGAVLEFDAAGDLVDFVSDDRLRDDPHGPGFTRMRWSTPVTARADFAGRRLVSRGSGVWHAPEPEGTFAYIEIEMLTIESTPAPR